MLNEQTVIFLIFGALVLALCLWRPHAGRIFLGIFFALMAAVHVVIVLTSPGLYAAIATTTWFPPYRWFFGEVVARSPVFFGLLAGAAELAISLLILSKGRAVRMGLLGGLLSQVAIFGIGIESLGCLLIAAAFVVLLRYDYPHSLWEMIAGLFHRHPPAPQPR